MPWFFVDDHLALHPKVVQAGNSAMGLWVRAGSWCSAHLTDGRLPYNMVPALGAQRRDARRLVDAGLWEQPYVENEDYRFVDWLHYQKSKAQVEATREAERIKKQRQRGVECPHGTTSGIPLGSPGAPFPTLPIPIDNKGLEGPERRRRSTRIPEDWAPADLHRERATAKGIDVDVLAEEMRNWAESKDERKVDWNKAFTNWIIRANKTPSNALQQRASSGRVWQE